LHVPRLDILPGQLTYIGGETGCGKSTLLKLLALETVPQQGEVVIMGFPVTNLPQDKRDDLRGGGIVYLAQGDMGLRNLTPVENIKRLLYDFDGLSWEDAERLALDGLRVAQFPADRLEVKAMDLSGGEKARVALAKLYAARRPICLTDETLGPLDDKMRLRLIALFQMLAARQFTIISIEHQPQLMDYFDRVITLEKGQIQSVVDHPRQQVQAP
jgi:ABC-type lipoprotein export system ATPase subunit